MGKTGAARAWSSGQNFSERKVYMSDETQSLAESGGTTTPTTPTEGEPKDKGDFAVTVRPKDKGDFSATPAPADGTKNKP
jgi:hypothetical protein